MPSFDVLNLIEKKHRTFAIHFLMAFQQSIEIFGSEILKPLVLEVQIKDLISSMPFSQ